MGSRVYMWAYIATGLEWRAVGMAPRKEDSGTTSPLQAELRQSSVCTFPISALFSLGVPFRAEAHGL